MKRKALILTLILTLVLVVIIIGIFIPKTTKAANTGEAYSVLDSDGEMTFFRSESAYTNNTTGNFTDIDGNSYSGRVFTEFEDSSQMGVKNAPWNKYYTDIQKVSMAQSVAPTDISWWFYNCSNATEIRLDKIDSSNITKMEGVFENCSALKTLDIHTLTGGEEKSMEGMIHGLSALSKIKLGSSFSFNANAKSKLELPDPFAGEAYAVFDSADGSLTFFRDEEGKYINGQTDGTKTYYTGLETLQATTSPQIPWNVNSSNVQSVTFQDPIQPVDTAFWFADMNNTNFTSITGLEKLDTSKVTDMNGMFNYCQSLTTLDVSHFDTSNVTNMVGMFSNCTNLTTLDVSHFDTSNVTNMYGMFYGCKNLTTLDVSHFDTSNVTNMGNMFDHCDNLTSLDVSHFDTSKVTDMRYMFGYCQSLTTLDVSHFDTSNVTSMASMFYRCRSLTTTLNITKMPPTYTSMCSSAATVSGARITLKYISPVTSANIDKLVATKSSGSNVVNGGAGTFVPPTPPVPLN